MGMRYSVILLALCAFLSADTKRIDFQGTLSNADGSPYSGKISTYAQLYDHVSANANGNLLLGGKAVSQKLNIANGSYTLSFVLTDADIDELNRNNTDGFFLQVYVGKGDIDENTLKGDPSYKLSPRMQIMAVPVAFAARGVYFNTSGSILRVGESYKTSSSQAAAQGMIVEGPVGVGTSNPEGAMLHVTTANSGVTTNIAILVDNGYNITANTIYADRVYNVKWD
ncbi:MAG: hypothetical protein LBQ83_07440 [Candidatus Margulisbacteria bacterium]|nr:hypothetical protein [Candidatus Margulisiibacteriota bacterium]